MSSTTTATAATAVISPLAADPKLQQQHGKEHSAAVIELERNRHDVSSQHTPLMRYGAYAAAIARCARYLAYTSDVGEAFRPVVHVRAVQACYGVSWGYVIASIAWDNQSLQQHGVSGTDLWAMTAKSAVFQSVASMALPAFTIHTVVHQTKHRLFQKFLPRFVQWGPTLCGLAVVPFLPLMWDYPCEVLIDKAFDAVYEPKSEYLKQQKLEQHEHHA